MNAAPAKQAANPDGRLICLDPSQVDGGKSEVIVPLKGGKDVTVGRGDTSTFMVASRKLSRQHARLFSGEGYLGDRGPEQHQRRLRQRSQGQHDLAEAQGRGAAGIAGLQLRTGSSSRRRPAGRRPSGSRQPRRRHVGADHDGRQPRCRQGGAGSRPQGRYSRPAEGRGGGETTAPSRDSSGLRRKLVLGSGRRRRSWPAWAAAPPSGIRSTRSSSS